MMDEPLFDLITLGRCGMDLYSLDIGAPFTEISAFSTAVGGSPTNIAIAASRLGLRVAALTAVGDDRVGDFILAHLAKESVDIRFVPRKPGKRTGLALLGIEPPDRFPLVFYRDDPADIHLNIEDVSRSPVSRCRALLLSGTAVSRGACRDATIYAAERGHAAGATVFVDLDLRPDQWAQPAAFGVNLRTLLPYANVLIGTEEEFYAALSSNPGLVFGGGRLGAAERQELTAITSQLLDEANTSVTALVVKRGARGASLLTRQAPALDVAGYDVEVVNTVGAGDAFAGGLIFGRLQGWDWTTSIRMGNACGALVVTRHGCAVAMPYRNEIDAFDATLGGL